ncbi:hypothetical protein N8920_02570 [Opitutales bacterium]|nr:hypothetical protein [Opitutales bacterium]
MIAVFDRDAIRARSIGLVFITEADAKKTSDDMAAIIDSQPSVRKGYPFSWCRLPSNGQVRHIFDLDIIFQPDRAAEIKYDGSRSLD